MGDRGARGLGGEAGALGRRIPDHPADLGLGPVGGVPGADQRQRAVLLAAPGHGPHAVAADLPVAEFGGEGAPGLAERQRSADACRPVGQ